MWWSTVGTTIWSRGGLESTALLMPRDSVDYMQARLFLIHKNRRSHKAGRLIVRLIHAASWVTLGFLATGCTQNSMERHTAQELDVPMHEVCLGPYLVEVPAALGRDARQLDAGGDATFYFGQDENLTKLDVTVRDVAGEEAYAAAVDPGEERLGTFVEDGRRLHGFYAENTGRCQQRRALS
ncbi:hypothetical protein CO641_08435 [Lysobacteraceae bacterium NML91-0213]|nr:hypothetical protein CO641_08435 [Xanthomonadaceae bacterium NML91-0213]